MERVVNTRNIELRFVGKEIWIEWVGRHYTGQSKLIKLPVNQKAALRNALVEVQKLGARVDQLKKLKVGGVTISYTGVDGVAFTLKPFFGKPIVIMPDDVNHLIADLDKPRPELEYGHHAYKVA